jgi:hypothetical protein
VVQATHSAQNVSNDDSKAGKSTMTASFESATRLARYARLTEDTIYSLSLMSNRLGWSFWVKLDTITLIEDRQRPDE